MSDFNMDLFKRIRWRYALIPFIALCAGVAYISPYLLFSLQILLLIGLIAGGFFYMYVVIRIRIHGGDDIFEVEQKPDFSNTPLSELITKASAGNADAQKALGDHYKYKENDPKMAAEWYQRAADQNNYDALGQLGIMYASGSGVERDRDKAKSLLTRAAGNGSGIAAYNLGVFYEKEECQMAAAFEWYKRSADLNVVGGHTKMGVAYLYGRGVKRDYDQAEKHFLKDVEKDYITAIYYMGYLYRAAREDYQKAIEWFNKAAARGDENSIYHLADMTMSGEGLKQDHKKGIEMLCSLAEKNLPAALDDLGRLYATGDCGVEKDLEKASNYWERSAAQGVLSSMHNLSILYLENWVDKSKYAQGISYLQKCAESGYDQDMLRLGNYYYDGEKGLKKSFEKAMEYYAIGRRYGHFGCIYSMGYMYEHGEGVEANLEKAIELYREGAKLGSQNSAKALKRLNAAE